MTTILFDLDGTLINTASIVLPAFKETLEYFRVAVPDEATLRSTFGMPDEDIWKMLMPQADDETRMAAFRQAESHITKGMFDHDILIANARYVLEALFEQGHTLTTASNCGTGYLNAVLDSQDIRRFFTKPLCLELVGGSTKADILSAHFRSFNKAECVMVGDRSSDVQAARTHGIRVVGCELGFGSAAELANADIIVHDLRELLPLFSA